jgi:hypothetical protein
VTAFLSPDLKHIQEAARFRFDAVEIHTGAYANAGRGRVEHELKRVKEAAGAIRHLGMRVHAGHGLNYHNIGAMRDVPGLEEVNIGHSIVARRVRGSRPRRPRHARRPGPRVAPRRRESAPSKARNPLRTSRLTPRARRV